MTRGAAGGCRGQATAPGDGHSCLSLGTKTVKIDQKKVPPIDKLFVSVGKFEFPAGATATVEVSNADTDGHVIVDAVQLVPAQP